MELIYATTNKAKVESMSVRTEGLGVRILSLADVAAPKLDIAENGTSPLENARIKALAYYAAIKRPLFSADSGLYIDELDPDDTRQPGVNVRGIGDWMADDDAIAHYSALAREFGGKITARYKNALCLVLGDGQIYEHMSDDITSEPFIITDTPHSRRVAGFPLDSLSIHIESGWYYFDIENREFYSKVDDGYTAFFRRVLAHVPTNY